MTFDDWWASFRGFDDPPGKDGARMAFEAGALWERTRCRYPECTENEEGECLRWMTDECKGPNIRTLIDD